MWTSADSNAQRFTRELEKAIKKNARSLASGMSIADMTGKRHAFKLLEELDEKISAELFGAKA